MFGNVKEQQILESSRQSANDVEMGLSWSKNSKFGECKICNGAEYTQVKGERVCGRCVHFQREHVTENMC